MASNDLLHELETARQQLDSQLAALRSADALHLHADIIGQGGVKLIQLNALRDQLVSSANGAPPAAIRAAVASAVADIRAYTSEARNAAAVLQGGTARQAAEANLMAASNAARGATTDFMDDYYKRRIFDPYLTFASSHDEQEYRQREQERQRAIEKALAEHTPEGDLRANQLAINQMNDAGTHGATRSPDFEKRLEKLNATNAALTAELARTPAQAAATPPAADPLDAAKPCAPVSPELIASLRASGVVVPDQNATGHGVTAAAAQLARARSS